MLQYIPHPERSAFAPTDTSLKNLTSQWYIPYVPSPNRMNIVQSFPETSYCTLNPGFR